MTKSGIIGTDARPSWREMPARDSLNGVQQRPFRGTRQNRALRLFAGLPLGCTEAIMLAHGFTAETLGRLVLDGPATATPGTVNVAGRPIKVTWLTITDIGRQALAGM